jgi:3-oxoacyl-[acyl-carrier protein] reductase
MARTLDGRVTIVTGGARGIGRGIAGVLAGAGARIVVADLDVAAGEAAAKDLEKAGGEATFVETDVTDRDSCAAAARATVEHLGRIDVLCSNAGIYPIALLDDMSEEEWDRVFDINVKGMFLMVKAVLPTMRAQGHGRMVLTSSVTGPVTGFPGWAHYGATKAAMLGFMRSAAIELAPSSITINAVMPGNIMTEGMKDMGEDYINALRDSIPMGELGDPEDIGNAILFLASDEAKYITGQTIVIDGGQLLPEGSDWRQAAGGQA